MTATVTAEIESAREAASNAFDRLRHALDDAGPRYARARQTAGRISIDLIAADLTPEPEVVVVYVHGRPGPDVPF